jgi:hypothetical protein
VRNPSYVLVEFHMAPADPQSVNWSREILRLVPSAALTVVGLLIAWRQVGIAHRQVNITDQQAEFSRRRSEIADDKLKLDLFERRLKVCELRKRCEEIVQECVAATRAHLRDDKAWPNHLERKNRATQKTA